LLRLVFTRRQWPSELSNRAVEKQPALLRRKARLKHGRSVGAVWAISFLPNRLPHDTRLGGIGFGEAWSQVSQDFGNQAATAKSAADAATTVKQNLDGQRSAVSGVSSDEESINMLAFQRQYQGAARVIQIADQLLQTIINLV
jgi:hypothetical protein